MILKEAARKRVAFFYLSGLYKFGTEKSLSPEKKLVIRWTESLDFCLNLHLYTPVRDKKSQIKVGNLAIYLYLYS